MSIYFLDFYSFFALLPLLFWCCNFYNISIMKRDLGGVLGRGLGLVFMANYGAI